VVKEVIAFLQQLFIPYFPYTTMKKPLLRTLVGLTLVLTACGKEPTPPTEIAENTALTGTLTETGKIVSPAVIGTANNADAELTLQDGVYYYDFGTVNITNANNPLTYTNPLAFTIDLPATQVADLTATVMINDGFTVDTTSEYSQGELFTIAVDTTAQNGARSAVIEIKGTTTNAQPIVAVFVATVELIE
jgi:hypothetical protein